MPRCSRMWEPYRPASARVFGWSAAVKDLDAQVSQRRWTDAYLQVAGKTNVVKWEITVLRAMLGTGEPSKRANGCVVAADITPAEAAGHLTILVEEVMMEFILYFE